MVYRDGAAMMLGRLGQINVNDVLFSLKCREFMESGFRWLFLLADGIKRSVVSGRRLGATEKLFYYGGLLMCIHYKG